MLGAVKSDIQCLDRKNLIKISQDIIWIYIVYGEKLPQN